MKKLIICAAIPLLVSGCYYPVYSPNPYPYGYAPQPAPQGGPMPDNSQDCRPYTQSSVIEGKNQQITGQACRQPDGSWHDTASGAPVDMGSAGPAPAPQAYPAPAYAPAPAYYPAPVYYPAPAYYAEPYPEVIGGGFYVGGGGRGHWR